MRCKIEDAAEAPESRVTIVLERKRKRNQGDSVLRISSIRVLIGSLIRLGSIDVDIDIGNDVDVEVDVNTNE